MPGNPQTDEDGFPKLYQGECMRRISLLLMLLLFLILGLAYDPINAKNFNNLAPLAQEPEAITTANWRQHPKIKAVRSVVESVNAGKTKGAFKNSVRKFEYCEPYEDTLRRMAVDSQGIVRWYQKEAGSEDSSLTWEHYYDEAGRLRFVFISGGAVNGAKLEHRIYFDESGKRIWEEQKYVKGPGYTFPEVWPDEQLQKSDVAKAFAASSPCRKQKVR
jgi:hypothetical protein